MLLNAQIPKSGVRSMIRCFYGRNYTTAWDVVSFLDINVLGYRIEKEENHIH